MANDALSYGVGLKFESAMKGLRTFKTALKNVNKIQEESLERQIALRKQLTGVTPPPTTPNTPTKPNKPEPLDKEKKERLKLLKIEKKRIRALVRQRNIVKNSVFMNKINATTEEKTTQQSIRAGIAKARTANQVKKILVRQKALLKAEMSSNKVAKKKLFLMKRMENSSKQLAGNMLSAFALAGAGSAVVRIGQDFEAVRNTMKAVSSDTKEAGDNMGFVTDEAFRLGLNLKESAKGFAKMRSAAGDMSLKDVKAAFTGVSEMSTLLGLSSEESNRAINALQQMMSKGVVSAEELKLQMGEVLPNAIQIMAKSAKDAGLTVNGTVGEMMKLQQTGGLISSQVLPHFAKNMSKAARANGGLDDAMKSNRVSMQRFGLTLQMAADTIFKTGLSEGLTEFFNDTAKMIKEAKPLWMGLGKIIGSVFKFLAWTVRNILSPALSALGSIINFLGDALGGFVTLIFGKFSPGVNMAVKRVGGWEKAMRLFAKGTRIALAPLILLIGALEEVAEFMSPTGKRTLIGTNVNDLLKSDNKALQGLGKTLKSEGNNPFSNAGLSALPGPFGMIGTVVTVKDIIMDKEKVGEMVIETSSVQDTARQATYRGYGGGGNY